ncbi:MAG: hypothetical protein Q9200_006618 [Gallowayella weberi]
MFNVNHFIVSQVNPHVVPFLLKEEDCIAQQAQQSTSATSSGPSWLHIGTHLAKDEALHRMRTMAEIGIFPNALTKAVSVLSQKYSGDITIFPEISYNDFPRMLSNPTPESMANAMLCGERATWPKLSRIRNHCAIELALDDAVQKLRARVVFSPSRVDLRIGIPTRSRSDVRTESRGKRKERPLSQNSAPATAPPHQPKHNKISKTKTHRKSRSMTMARDANAVITATVPRVSTQDLTAAEERIRYDITTSSGAETPVIGSSRNSSSSTLSVTSPFDSDASPPSSPNRATYKRPLSSTSQPTTPSVNHFCDLPTRPKGKDSPPVSALLSMTPKMPPAESTSKRPSHSKAPRDARKSPQRSQ